MKGFARKSLLVLISCWLMVLGVYAQSSPIITAFTPASGTIGTLIKITGHNLAYVSGVSLGAVPAVVISDDSTQIVAFIMPGSATGPVSVSTTFGSTVSAASFTAVPNTAGYAQTVRFTATDLVGTSSFSASLALSADGNTLLVGGPNDNTVNQYGAAWVFRKQGTTWVEQQKLLPAGLTTNTFFGKSVAISADGNTVLVGSSAQTGGKIGAWVFTYDGSNWSSGFRLTPTDSLGLSGFGSAVSLSADGFTALVGGPKKNANQGAAWVFVQPAGLWIEQAKLTVNDTIGAATFGNAVSLSADGNTALIGGSGDSSKKGAGWVFTRSGTVWNDTVKLKAAGSAANSAVGFSVSLSADGLIAALGARNDSNKVGATWVFRKVAGTWDSGIKVKGTGGVGGSNGIRQGSSVSLSAGGDLLGVGGPVDSIARGASWIFKRSGNSWLQDGGLLLGNGHSSVGQQGSAVALSADGNQAVIGGPGEGGGAGAVWAFSPSGALPVTLFSFTAYLKQNNPPEVKLVWTTAAEINNAAFEIEHSLDGYSFVRLSQVPGAGSTTLFHAYNFTDAKPAGGLNYYRLKMIGEDGSSTYSTLIAINNDRIIATALEAYPNPAVAVLYLRYPGLDARAVEVKLWNESGINLSVPIYTEDELVTLDVTRLAPGHYHLLVSPQGKNAAWVSFIKI